MITDIRWGQVKPCPHFARDKKVLQLKASDANLQGILQSPNQYVIPVFQRFYSWHRDDWKRLWDSLLELREPEHDSRGHFMGSLVFVPEPSLPNKVPAFQVIDGQQRLTTLSLLLCALRDVARDAGFAELHAEITENYLVHRFKKDREHYKVYPRQRDRDSYLAAVSGQGVVSGNIGDALGYFAREIRSMAGSDTEEELRALFSLLQSRLDFVHITLEGENPYQIFKSLNSTGVDLSEGDLIRNFMFMHVGADTQDNFDDTKWKPLEKHFENDEGTLDGRLLSAFFRDFLMREGRYVTPDATFETFEKQFSTSNFAPANLADELNLSANDYDIIRGVSKHPNGEVEAALLQLRQLDSSTAYPIVLRLFRCHHLGNLDATDLAEAVCSLSGFILRRLVCGQSSRAYGRWFVTACSTLSKAPLAELWQFLIAKGFPSDNNFASSLLRFNLYDSRYCRSVLQELEKAHHHKEPADLALTQIEHIMPQTLTGEWKTELGSEWQRVYDERRNTLGNLTLTAYNPELSNRPFTEKRDGFHDYTGYKNSNIVITRDLGKHTNWTESEIVARGQNLAQLAMKIWQGP